MIKGERADYSKSLFEIKGIAIYCKQTSEFVDILKGIFPKDIANRIICFRLNKKLNRSV